MTKPSATSMLLICASGIFLAAAHVAMAQDDAIVTEANVEGLELAPLDIELPEAFFGGTPMDYWSPILEPESFKARPPFLAPVGTTNLAKGKTVTSSVDPLHGELSQLTDGDKDYVKSSLIELPGGVQWVQVDLGGEHTLYAVLLWHFHEGNRVYHDIVVQASNDPQFKEEVTVLYNNDHDNSAGLGAGQDMEYKESNRGRLIDAKGVNARFVRMYSQGNTANDMNNYVEVEVYGIPASGAIAARETAPTSYQAEYIFPMQDKHVHSSSIVQCPNGDFLAAWFHGSGERNANDVQVLGARLKKGDTAWSEVFPMADTPNVPDCNPVLFIDASEKLWLIWQSVWANRWERGVLKYRTSTDYQGNGAPKWDWQDVIFTDPGDSFPEDLANGFKALGFSQPMWAEYAPEYDRMLVEAARDKTKRIVGWMPRVNPITTRSGRIILPLYSDGYNVSIVMYSDDLGEHWTMSKPIVGLGPIQPSVAQRKDGTLVAFMRDSGDEPKRILKATSSDDGATWSTATDTDIPNPSSTAVLCVLKDGRWVLICNDTEDGRHQLAAMISEDEGKTWKATRYLEKSEYGQGSYSYPNIIQAADGKVHVTYSYSVNRQASIKHVAFAPEWITAGN